MSLAPKPFVGEVAPAQVRRPALRLLAGAFAAGMLASAGWLVTRVWGDISMAGSDAVRALWTVPAIVALHLVQLLLSALGWRSLFVQAPVGTRAFFWLRLMREGLNSLLPLAHVGGEVIAIQLMARHGIPVALGAASVVVDVTMEVCSQLAFLVAGCLVLAWLSGAASAWLWADSLGIAVLAAGGLLLAQRLQGLRLLERAVHGIGRRWPALAISSIEGLNAETLAIYRRPRRLLAAFLIQGTAWMLGTGETWLVLYASQGGRPARSGLCGREPGSGCPQCRVRRTWRTGDPGGRVRAGRRRGRPARSAGVVAFAGETRARNARRPRGGSMLAIGVERWCKRRTWGLGSRTRQQLEGRQEPQRAIHGAGH